MDDNRVGSSKCKVPFGAPKMTGREREREREREKDDCAENILSNGKEIRPRKNCLAAVDISLSQKRK